MKSRRGREVRGRRFWARHCEEWLSSGLSQRAYCERHGLALSTFQLWRRRLVTAVEGSGGPAADFELVPFTLQPVTETAPSCPAVLVLAEGRYRVEVTEGVAPAALRVLLDALECR